MFLFLFWFSATRALSGKGAKIQTALTPLSKIDHLIEDVLKIKNSIKMK